MIYLDYSANTPVDEAVLRRFCEVEQRCLGNANSIHRAGAQARAELENATLSIARLLHAQPAEVIYTSGASEANNFALKRLAELEQRHGMHLITTPLEHASVRGSLEALQKRGFEVELARLRPDGSLDLEDLGRRLRPDTTLVAVSAVDSELGVVQPIAELSALLHARCPHAHLHVDATQAVGKIPVSFDGADTMSLTAHKFYGLNGIGLLLKRRHLMLEPLIHGGRSATPYRSGTPTVALAASMALALELAVTHQAERTRQVRLSNLYLRQALSRHPDVQYNSPAGAVPHILNLSVKGVKGTVFQRALDERGVCVSVRSACASDGQPSPAVLAVTGDRRRALSSFRVSLSHQTTPEELDFFLRTFAECLSSVAHR